MYVGLHVPGYHRRSHHRRHRHHKNGHKKRDDGTSAEYPNELHRPGIYKKKIVLKFFIKYFDSKIILIFNSFQYCLRIWFV